MFNDPNMIQKLAANPKTASYLADPDFMNKLQQLKTNPSAVGAYMQDPRFLQVMSVMLGIDMQMGGPGGMGGMGGDAGPSTQGQGGQKSRVEEEDDEEMPDLQPIPKKTEKAPEPEPEPEPEEDEEAKAAKEAKAKADELKKKGTELYKKRQFDEAIENYTQAWELHKDIAYKTNEGAAKFEKGDYEGCIKACHEAIEYGREVYADFKIIAKFVTARCDFRITTNTRQGICAHRLRLREDGRSRQRRQLLPEGADRTPHTRGPRQAPSSREEQDHKGQGVLHQPRRGREGPRARQRQVQGGRLACRSRGVLRDD
jgi:tetratricopeptide (TPR) repeat protein